MRRIATLPHQLQTYHEFRVIAKLPPNRQTPQAKARRGLHTELERLSYRAVP